MQLEIAAAVAVLAAGAVAAELGGRRLIRRMFRVPRLAKARGPADLGLPCDEVSIATAGGKRLFGWYVPPPGPSGPAVAVVHGWGASADLMLPLAPLLHAGGFGVLLIDSRCHGRSDDDDFASMPRFAEDLSCALDWLKARPEVGAIAALGHSVGASATILTASRRDDLFAAVAIAAFAHPAELMRRFMDERRIPFWPVGWWVLRKVERAIGHRYDDIAPRRVVARVRCPLLLVHGDRDEVTPAADAEAIFANRGAATVVLRKIAGAGHNPTAYVRRHGAELVAFLRDAAGL